MGNSRNYRSPMPIDRLRAAVVGHCRQQIRMGALPNWWRDPLLVTATADERFDLLPKIAAPNHLLPRDLLAACQTVVVFFIPFSADLSNENIAGKFPSAGWGLSLSLTNDLIQRIAEFIGQHLDRRGYRFALTPATYNFDPASLTARWSHKHLAHLSGLGRFGLNAQLITPAGCAGRLGSLVTDADLGNHPLVAVEELCLQKSGQECRICQRTCPVNAIGETGIDRHRCNQRLQVNRKRFAARPDLPKDCEVCAKCVSGMPCDLQAPTRQSAANGSVAGEVPGRASCGANRAPAGLGPACRKGDRRPPS